LKKVAILGATGPTGKHLARILAGRGVAVRAVSRSETRLAKAFAGATVERLAADLLDADGARRAVSGCDTAFDCVGLPMEAIGDHPLIARQVAAAARGAGCRLVQVSSFWSYLPVVRLPLDENHPRTGGPYPVQARREAEDILQAAGAAILHLPDFYGPEVHTGTLQNGLSDAIRDRAVGWIGSPELSRDYAYVPDAMDTAARLAEKDAAYGERWILPGAGPVSLTGLLEIVAGHLGYLPKVRAAPPWLLRLLARFNGPLRQFLPMLPHYAQPISYSGARLRGLLGEFAATPYEQGIIATLDWLRRAVPSGGA